MFQKRLLALMFTHFAFAGAASAQTETRISLSRAADQITARNFDMLILADTDHLSANLVGLFGSVVYAMSRVSGEHHPLCLFVETDLRINDEYDRYIRGASFESSVIQRLQVIYNGIGRPIDDMSAERAYEELLQLARAGQLKAIAYDIDFGSELGRRLVTLFPAIVSGTATAEQLQLFQALEDQRHQAMIDSVAQRFRSNHCAKGILLAGEGHVQNIHSPPSFPVQLRSQGFSLIVARAVSRECNHPEHPNHDEAGCTDLSSRWDNIGYADTVVDDSLFQFGFVGP